MFEGARVPAANLLGEQGSGFKTFLRDPRRRPDLDRGARGRHRPGARSTPSIPYAQTREQFGRPIGSFQGVAFMVADMATEIEAARGAGLARGLAQGPGSRLRARRRRRPSCSPRRSARASTNNAIQIHGGYGYVTDYPVERFLRDAKLTEIGEGTSQVQRLVIARRILGLRVV